MNRVNKNIFFMANALLTSTLSYCKRRQVGVVIVKDNRILVNGYNGTISGTENVCEYPIMNCFYCNTPINIKFLEDNGLLNLKEDKYYFKCPHCDNEFIIQKDKVTNLVLNPKTDHIIVVHAEQNAIVWASKMGISIRDASMYVTDAPCGQCAKLIVQAGIKEVYYMRDFRTKEGIELFKRINFPYYKIDEKNVYNYLKGVINE